MAIYSDWTDEVSYTDAELDAMEEAARESEPCKVCGVCSPCECEGEATVAVPVESMKALVYGVRIPGAA